MYSYSAEKSENNKGTSTRQTLHADVTPADNDGGNAHSNNSIRNSDENVKGKTSRNETDNAAARMRELASENKRLNTQVEELKAQFKTSEKVTTRPEDVRKIARSFVEGTQLKAADITDDLQALYDFMGNNGTETEELTNSGVRSRATQIAREIVNNDVILVNDDDIQTRLKKTEDFAGAKETQYDDIVSDLEGNRGFVAMSDEQQQKALDMASDYANVKAMLESDLDYEIPSTSGWIEKAEGGAPVGLELWEYILFRAAYDMIESDKDKDGKTVSGSKQEKVIDELKDMAWLTNKERDYIFGTLYSSNKNNPFD